jgi:hypothetical protein
MRRTPIIHTLRSDGTYTTAAALASDTGATPTFARNCTAYRDYWDGTTRKLVEVAANVPRWCTRKDGAGNLRSGLLIEPGFTNVALRSNRLDLSPNGLPGINALTQSGTPKWGDVFALWKMSEDPSINAGHGSNQHIGAASGWYCCQHVFAKGTRDFAFVAIERASQANESAIRLWFNLDTGEIGTVRNDANVPVAYSVRSDGGVWVATLAAELPSQTDWYCFFYSCISDGLKTHQGGAGQYCFQGCTMFGKGIYPGSYIATTTAPVTRLKDDYSLNVTGRIGQRGSLVFDIMFPAQDLVAAVVPVSLHDGSADNRITCSILAAGDVASATVVSGGDTQADITDATTDVCDGDRHTIAISWEPNSVKLYVDGTLEGTADTSATIPSGITTLTLADHAGANQCGGLISDLKLYSRPGVTS